MESISSDHQNGADLALVYCAWTLITFLKILVV